ncbi:hypothetical protein ACTHGU_06065 [Chitinophagaceae bacterium MMS25-I14]
MIYILSLAAVCFFIAHVLLLVASFAGRAFLPKRYFYSHLTLWITGIIVFVLALMYSGTNQSGFLDYFDTPMKKGMILIVTLGLSLVAHTIVTLFIKPASRRTGQL